MAGIGFTLRRLTEQDNLVGTVQGYVYATFITAGPWLFTILCLGAINLLTINQVGQDSLGLFRLITIYNFAFSLTFCGPVTMVVTRYLADRIYEKQVETAPGTLLGGLALLWATQGPLVLWFYGFQLDLEPMERLAAIWNYMLVAGIWLVGVFLTAIKDYKTVSFAFLGGMVVALGSTVVLAEQQGGLTGLLLGFDVGLSVVLFVLIGRIFGEYPYPPRHLFDFLSYFRRYWDLAMLGFLTNAALWVDKWIMWFAPEAQVVAGGLRYYPAYDSAMFMAYLTIIPAMAQFVLHIETSFYRSYQGFFNDLQNHAPYRTIAEGHQRMVKVSLSGLRNAAVFQGAIAALAVASAPKLFDALGASYMMMGMFRLGVVGACFQTLLLFLGTLLAYFDLRRNNVALQALFLALNAGLTLVFMDQGLTYYGLGYLFATAIALVVTYAVTFRQLMRVPFLVFVGNNPSVKNY